MQPIDSEAYYNQPQQSMAESSLASFLPGHHKAWILRDLVIDYLGGLCIYCGSNKHLHLHHSLPIYAGGTNTMGNLELVCGSCHRNLHIQLRKLYPFETDSKDTKHLEKRDMAKVVRIKIMAMLRAGMTKSEIAQVARIVY